MASASFCNRTASRIVSPRHQLCKQTRPQVHCHQARDHQQCHPYPLQHHRQRSERGPRLFKQLLCSLPYRLLQSCVWASRLFPRASRGIPHQLHGIPHQLYGIHARAWGQHDQPPSSLQLLVYVRSHELIVGPPIGGYSYKLGVVAFGR